MVFQLEKSKKSATNVHSYTLENCPEPKLPPKDHCPHSNCNENVHHDIMSPKVYNKQIINNQFTKSPMVPFVSTQCKSCNIPVQTVAIPTPPPFNPNIWAIPAPQFFIAPSVTPMEVSMNDNRKNAQFSTSVSLSRHFGSQFGVTKNKPKRPFVQRKLQNEGQRDDLRALITAKKGMANYCVETDVQSKGNKL